MAARLPRTKAAVVLAGAGAVLGAGGVALLGAGLSGRSAPPSPVAVPAAAAASAVAAPAGAPSAPPAPARPREQPPADLLPASPPTRVSVPDLGIDTALVRLGLDASGAMQVPADGASVGWYERSPTPGQVGPTVLAGHVSWDARPAVFFDLGAMRAGQRVTVRREDGASVTYRVTAVHEYPKDAFPTLQVYGNTAGPELRLITCGGTFDTATGHHRDDVVVYAALESVAPA